MVTLQYGTQVLKIKEDKFLSPVAQKLLLDGKFVVDTGIAYDADDKVRKAYYIGVLFEIFQRNHEEFSKMDVYMMMIIAYPLFMKPRQIQNILPEYYKLKSTHDVFTAD